MKTPEGPKDVRKRMEWFVNDASPTGRKRRTFIRKVMKSMGRKDIEIAELKQRFKSLGVVIQRLRPKKRAKVDPNPNKRLVRRAEVERIKKKSGLRRNKRMILYQLNFMGLIRFAIGIFIKFFYSFAVIKVCEKNEFLSKVVAVVTKF